MRRDHGLSFRWKDFPSAARTRYHTSLSAARGPLFAHEPRRQRALLVAGLSQRSLMNLEVRPLTARLYSDAELLRTSLRLSNGLGRIAPSSPRPSFHGEYPFFDVLSLLRTELVLFRRVETGW